ncbi:MarR family transcriptional regulator [Qipengyuania sp. ASV99]|uniref:MarR family transcriptional regulator n=1 Tax=Qipengyuania sp. ASV99 TaxID=3399681 RepID=UPI003A4C6AC3
MTQLEYQTTDFAYDAAPDAAQDASGVPARVAIFADRAAMRAQMGEDVSGAGFRAIDGGAIDTLLEGPIAMIGDVVMVDCPAVSAASLAALARLDMRAARTGAQLIVSTALAALDDVFAALDQSDPQILVEPSRAERLVAVGRTMARLPGARVREISEEDRLNLLHLSRQVDAIAHELDRLSGHRANGAEARAFAPEGLGRELRSVGGGSLRNSQPAPEPHALPLPDPRRVRQIIAARQARAKFFEGELFADPAWDMLLDLTAARAERSQVSVTSLCIAAAVPATTALRWIKQLVDTGVFVRVADESDRRRAFVALSEPSAQAMARYFAEVEVPLARAA